MGTIIEMFESICIALWTAAILCAVVKKYPVLYPLILAVGGFLGVAFFLTRMRSHGAPGFFDLLGMITGVFLIVLAVGERFGH